MKTYNNYKKTTFIMKLEHFYHRILDTRIKRIIVNSAVAFCVGIGISYAVLSVAGNMELKKSVGGLETAGVPDFKESDFESGFEIENPSFEETAFLQEGETDAENDSLDMATKILDEQEEKQNDLELCYYTYRVKKGDMIGFIADNFGVTQDTIISVNNIHQSRLLQIDQYLKIPSMPGIVYTVKKNGETVEKIAEKYEISSEKCARINSLDEKSSLVAGTTLFVPDAQLDWVTRQEINGDLFRKPIHGRYYLSSYFGWRSSPFSGKRSYHSGVDMACPMGTPIYAALGGTVSTVGFNNVYGNYIIVTHHSGYKTLYGHMSRTIAKKGQWVDAGTKIGEVGSTGLSTGPHLHFTVYKFGKLVNPAALWK